MGSLAIVVSTLLWGTLWIPLRHIDGAGHGSVWPTVVSLMTPVLIVVPLAILRSKKIHAGGRLLLVAGLSNAVAVALYSEGLLRGQVAHVILLFYLTPVWSTLLARIMLAEPITRPRIVAVTLGLAGMWVVFGASGGLPLPRTSAEWMGLLSGMCWGWSMVYIRRSEASASIDKLLVLLLFLGPAFLLVTAVPGGRAWSLPEADVLLRSSTWMLAFGSLWMPAVLWLTLFGASRVEPGRVAILLMLEVVIGLGSAALLTDEPFGARELLGAVLVVSACGADFLPARRAVVSRR